MNHTNQHADFFFDGWTLILYFFLLCLNWFVGREKDIFEMLGIKGVHSFLKTLSSLVFTLSSSGGTSMFTVSSP